MAGERRRLRGWTIVLTFSGMCLPRRPSFAGGFVILRDPDPAIRAQWQTCVLREARYEDVWGYVTLDDVLRDWDHIERHLGRRRAFWRYLLDGWRKDRLLPGV